MHNKNNVKYPLSKDDPFSSLDNEVSKWIFDNSIKSLLLKHQRTVVLVTQKTHLVHSSDYVNISLANELKINIDGGAFARSHSLSLVPLDFGFRIDSLTTLRIRLPIRSGRTICIRKMEILACDFPILWPRRKSSAAAVDWPGCTSDDANDDNYG